MVVEMITIGITICDKDYTNCQALLNQIESRVSVEHEVIIIDNREQYLDEPTEWKADYTFGYNAFQFTARKKIIELAKGEYIWFVDGDDSIIRLDEFDCTEDIVCYNLYSNNKVEAVANRVYTENLCSMDMLEVISLPLWNKIIRRSLYDDLSDYSLCDFKAVSMEDTFYLLFALKNAESLRTYAKTTYYHKKGISDLTELASADDFKKLVTGYRRLLELLRTVLKDHEDTFDKFSLHQRNYLYEAITAIQRSSSAENEIGDVAATLAEIIPEDILKEELYEKILPKITKKKYYDRVCKVLSDRFGEDFVRQYAVCTVTYFDEESGEIKEREEKYLKEIIFSEDEEIKWNHKLSIVCLVYDGNVHYLQSFTAMLDRVLVKHEVIIVDNRDDKIEPLEYSCDALVIENECNLGILDGRRKGFENSTGDYIWFVDIDDEVYYITDADYGDSDVIVFPFESCDECYFFQPGLIQKSDFWMLNTLWNTSSMVWNKWFKRDLLEKMYSKIPSFKCIYYEDNLLYFTMLEFAESIEVTDKTSSTVYSHRINEDSITCRHIQDIEAIDRLFIGYAQTIDFVENNFSEHRKLLDYSLETGIAFYMQIMARADESVKAYFAEKIKALFPSKSVSNALEMIKDTDFGQTISSYFVTPNDNSI